jgi:hypothetical protein
MKIRGFIVAIIKVVVKKSSKFEVRFLKTIVVLNKIEVKAHNMGMGTKLFIVLKSLSFFSIAFNFISIIINNIVFFFGLNKAKVIARGMLVATNGFTNSFSNGHRDTKRVFTVFNEVGVFNNIFVGLARFSGSKVMAVLIKKKVEKRKLINLNAFMVV